MKRRVVITGLGCVSAAGEDPGVLRQVLQKKAGLAKPERIEFERGEWLETSVARAARPDYKTFLTSARRRRMSQFSQDWVVACLLARADSGLTTTPVPERAGIFLGTAFGSLDVTLRYLDIIARDGPGLGNPFLFSESVANAPAGHAAIHLDCRAFNITLTCGDASGMAAVQCAARAIRNNRLDIAFAGGIEALPDALLAVLAGLGAVPVTGGNLLRQRLSLGPARTQRPPGEGVACFLLEPRELAESRGVTPYAEVRGGSNLSDPSTPHTRWSDSAELRAEVMRLALRGSDITPRDLDGVVLHGSGESRAAHSETQALERAILSGRSRSGHLAVQTPSHVVGQFAGAGAFGIAAAALAIRHGEESDRGVVSPVVSNRPGEARANRGWRHALVNAASWGGSCMSLVMSRPD